MSPRLRPGVVVVRRDDRHLQVGLEPPHRAVLPDVPEVRRLLDDLQHGRPVEPAQPREATALARLEVADLLAPAPAPAGAVATVTGPRALVDAATAALRAAGVRTGVADGTSLLLAQSVLARDAADELVRVGRPHLPAVLTPWGWEIGPFVVPGRTACLRCVEAARRDHDPRYGVVRDQLARASAAMPLDPALLALAFGWIARDLLAYERGVRPSTWSSTVRLADSPGEAAVDEQRWLRHAHCGCAWDALTG